ncbi:MAG: MazG family protein [Verrucomicrobia bacterium]|nr:MazG family protein [Verrucomicrobiota bacterium]
MEQFDTLLQVAERLLGPDGCDWDKKQTFLTLQPYILEETHEVLEAVDLGDMSKIAEELGDLLYVIVFYGKLAEKEGNFSIRDILTTIREKLIRRHPHVFGDVKVDGVDDIVKNWEKIKKQEKGEKKESALDGLPPALPALVRCQKVLKRMAKAHYPPAEKPISPCSEEEIGEEILQSVLRAEISGIDAESALRRALTKWENAFRNFERTDEIIEH